MIHTSSANNHQQQTNQTMSKHQSKVYTWSKSSLLRTNIISISIDGSEPTPIYKLETDRKLKLLPSVTYIKRIDTEEVLAEIEWLGHRKIKLFGEERKIGDVNTKKARFEGLVLSSWVVLFNEEGFTTGEVEWNADVDSGYGY